MKTIKSALFLGRFQPPHLGHEKAVAWMLKRHGKLTIAIGSSNKKREKDNPLSAQERKMLLRKIISSHKSWKGRIRLAFVPDCRRHEDWMELMLRKFGAERHVFYTNNKLVRKLFAARGFAVHNNPEFRRFEMEGTKIRRLVAGGKNYSERVSPEISGWMEKKGERIISASQLRFPPNPLTKP